MVIKLERIAIIDLGSNTARLLLVDVKENGHFQVIDQLKEAPRLGENMDYLTIIFSSLTFNPFEIND